MSQRCIAERLRERHEDRDNPHAWQELICTYKEECNEAADEIQRLRDANEKLCDQICVLHATGEENEYSQWERIRELEEVLTHMLRAFGEPIHDESVDGSVSYKLVCEILNRARAVLSPAGEPPA